MNYYYPQRPTLTSVYDNVGETGVVRPGQRTDDLCPVLSGRGTPGARLAILDNGKLLAYTSVGNDGSWHYKPSAPLAAGPHTFSVSSQGYSSAPYNVTLTPANHTPLKIESVIDNVGEKTGSVHSGEQLDDRRPVVNGTGTPGARVTLTENGAVVAHTLVGADGKWSMQPARDLQLGNRQLMVHSGSETSSVTVQVVSVKVAAPQILELIDNVGETGHLHSGDTTDDRRPVLKGTGVPGSMVWLMDNGRAIQPVVVDKQGNWTLQLTKELDAGVHQFSIYNEGRYSAPFSISVVPVKGTEPVITEIYDQVGEAGAVQPGEQSDDRRPLISGTSRPYTLIVLRENGMSIGSAYADGTGKWQLTPDYDLHYGEHQLVVTDGETQSAVFPITIVPVKDAQPAIELVRDSVGMPSDVINGGNSDDRRPAISGKGTPGKVIHLLANGTEVGQAIADAQGHWSITPYRALPLGKIELQVISDGLKSDAWTINLFEQTRITSLFDDVGYTGEVVNGGTTDDRRPQVNGVGMPGEVVKLINKGSVLGSTIVNEDGSWHIDLVRDMAPGDYQLRVYSQGQYSQPFYVTITETQQDGLLIDSLYDNVGLRDYLYDSGGHTDDRRPLLEGFGRPGVQFTLMDNGNAVAVITVDSEGVWQYQFQQDLTTGEHQFTLIAGSYQSPVFSVHVVELNITSVLNNIDDNVALQPGDTTQDDTPVFKGTGLPGDIIFLMDNGVKVGSGKVDAKGNWTLEPKWGLEPGEHELQIEGRGIKSDIFKLIVAAPESDVDDKPVNAELTLQALLHDAEITLFSQPEERAQPVALQLHELDMLQQSDAKGILSITVQPAALPVDDELHSVQY